ncbi:potassium channel family protein [Sphingomonas baiyangensis]|uniref:Potassium channel family protein n=1 Tax=Sphingomonas baiyangensis TaxID=2572576 RepID=A0A4U1L3N7_9SPHN|nr:potassium channel family protein [Sphingomonas baiyangensis]TKD50736.1 potassium channel family protein [Sphingomonas baiyangensis]
MRRTTTHATLTRKSALPVWASLSLRVLLVLALVSAAIAVHWFDRAGLRDNFDGEVSFADVVYFTMISITTTGYGDIAPVTERARLFDALIVTPIRIFVILIFVGSAYNFILKRTWEKWRMARIQRDLTDHIIVAGFGKTGSEAVDELIARGRDASTIVIIDGDPERLERAEACGCNVLLADATRDATLEDVKIERACSMIVAAGRDDTSILVVLTARHLAPDLPISIIVKAEDNEFPARAAGATTVINPVSFAGLLLASSCNGRHIADYMMDLASFDGRVQLAERRVAPHEVGKALRDLESGLGLRVYRGGKGYGWADPEAKGLLAGDIIVEIVGGRNAPA